jgi:hypothetical protein
MNTSLPPHPDLTPAGQAVVDFVHASDWVLYPALERVLSAFFEVRGDGVIRLSAYRHLVAWAGVSASFCNVINDALCSFLLVRVPVDARAYHLAGSYLRLPVAKGLRHYDRPHWLPMALRHIEHCAAEQLAAQKRKERKQVVIVMPTRAPADA